MSFINFSKSFLLLNSKKVPTRLLLSKSLLIPPRRNYYFFHTNNLAGYKFNDNNNKDVILRQFSNSCSRKGELDTTTNTIVGTDTIDVADNLISGTSPILETSTTNTVDASISEASTINNAVDNSIIAETDTGSAGDIDSNVPSDTVATATKTNNTNKTTTKVPKKSHENLNERIIKLTEQNKLDEAMNLILSEKDAAFKKAGAWNQLIIECSNKRKSKMTIRLFDEMNRLSLHPSQESYTAILKGLSSSNIFLNAVPRATSIINQIIQSSHTRPEIKLEIEHVNYLLVICQQARDFNVTLETYDNLIRSGKLKPNKETYMRILNICLAICTKQPETTYELTTDVWNKLVKHDEQQGEEENDAVVIDNELVIGVISVFKDSKHTQHAFDIIDSTYGFGKASTSSAEGEQSTTSTTASIKPALILPITNDVLTSIFALCFKVRQLNLGIEYYNQIITKYPDFLLDTHNYNNLITLYNFTYQYKKTLESYHGQFKKAGMVQSMITFEHLMAACQSLRDLSSAKEILENAIENQVEVKTIGATRLLKLTLEQARSTENYDDVCWLLEKIDKTGDIDFNEEKKGFILIKDMNDWQLLRALSSAHEIALEEVKDLSEEKRAQLMEDKKYFDHKADRLADTTSKYPKQNTMHEDDLRMRKIYQGRWKTKYDENWYNPDKNIKNQFPLAPPHLNRRYNNNINTYPKPSFSPRPNNYSSSYVRSRPPMYYNQNPSFRRPPPSELTLSSTFDSRPPTDSYGSFRGQYNRRRPGGYRGAPRNYRNVGYRGPNYRNS